MWDERSMLASRDPVHDRTVSTHQRAMTEAIEAATTRPFRVSRFLPEASSALCSWPRKPWPLADGPWRLPVPPASPRVPSGGTPPMYVEPPAGALAPSPLPAVRDRRPPPASVPGLRGPQGLA